MVFLNQGGKSVCFVLAQTEKVLQRMSDKLVIVARRSPSANKNVLPTAHRNAERPHTTAAMCLTLPPSLCFILSTNFLPFLVQQLPRALPAGLL